MILWGPPGVGKTTLAHLVAQMTKRFFVSFSAVLGGVKELRIHLEEARQRRNLHGRQTVLFIDEIHRFNKAQQDALLPHVENGTVTLIGATTENPSFEVNAALLSRARIIVLNALTPQAVEQLLQRAWSTHIRQQRWPDAQKDDDVLHVLSHAVDGDGRRALNALEAALNDGRALRLSFWFLMATLSSMIERGQPFPSGERAHQIYAATDPDAAAYWLMRMVDAGEDPIFIARRLVIFASEDIGHADPRALSVAVDAMNAVRLVGLPEGVYPLMQATTYLATAPKSNTILRTIQAARNAIKQHGSLPVPKHLRNGTTALNRSLGDGQGYEIHMMLSGPIRQSGLPDRLEKSRFLSRVAKAWRLNLWSAWPICGPGRIPIKLLPNIAGRPATDVLKAGARLSTLLKLTRFPFDVCRPGCHSPTCQTIQNR